MTYNHQKNIADIDQALQIGHEIIISLEQAEESLSSARNWGIVDMLGGGFFTNMIKHSKINNANDILYHAKSQIRHLENLIHEIHFTESLYIDISDFAVFADFFFDGLIADWYMQSKINENRERVQRVIQQMQDVIKRLEHLRTYEQTCID